MDRRCSSPPVEPSARRIRPSEPPRQQVLAQRGSAGGGTLSIPLQGPDRTVILDICRLPRKGRSHFRRRDLAPCPNLPQRGSRLSNALDRTAESCGFMLAARAPQRPLWQIWTSSFASTTDDPVVRDPQGRPGFRTRPRPQRIRRVRPAGEAGPLGTPRHRTASHRAPSARDRIPRPWALRFTAAVPLRFTEAALMPPRTDPALVPRRARSTRCRRTGPHHRPRAAGHGPGLPADHVRPPPVGCGRQPGLATHRCVPGYLRSASHPRGGRNHPMTRPREPEDKTGLRTRYRAPAAPQRRPDARTAAGTGHCPGHRQCVRRLGGHCGQRHGPGVLRLQRHHHCARTGGRARTVLPYRGCGGASTQLRRPRLLRVALLRWEQAHRALHGRRAAHESRLRCRRDPGGIEARVHTGSGRYVDMSTRANTGPYVEFLAHQARQDR